MNRPKTITNEQADIIIAALRPPVSLVARISRESGLRVSDVISLKKTQIKRTLSVKQIKTQKIKKTKLSAKLYADLQTYVSGSGSAQRSQYIFPRLRRRKPYNQDRHMTRQTVDNYLARAGEQTGIELSIHSFRKLYAQNIYTQTQSVEAVQEALQHSRIEITLTYLDLI